MANDNSFDVFGVAETRLGSEVYDSIVEVSGYSIIRQNCNVRGGGVLLYIKKNVKAKVLYKSKTEHPHKPLKPEYIFCGFGRKLLSIMYPSDLIDSYFN